MMADRTLKIMAGVTAAVASIAALHFASAVLAPLALALFVIAIVWPLYHRLASWLPTALALAISLLTLTAVCVAFASLAVWGFNRVGRSLMANAGHYQALYAQAIAWLDGHGISLAGVWADHFNVAWLVRVAQQATGRLNATMTFWLIALVYVMLGLLEVGDMRRKILSLEDQKVARPLLDGCTASAAKFRKFMLVRTQMSALTGLLVGVFAWLVGLPFPAEWGIIAFVLNYIPYIGPLIATVFPTALAMTQFDTWQAVLGIFLCMNVIQMVIGSYVEPRISGTALSISPFVVLFSVLFWTFLWGLFGTIIGVPITVAILTFCEQYPSSRWLAVLLGGVPPAEASPGN